MTINGLATEPVTAGRRRTGGRRTHAVRWAVLAVPLAFIGVFFLYPVGALLYRALHPGSHWDLSALVRVADSPAMRQVVAFTLWQAVLSTALVLAVGLPSAWVVSRYSFPGRGLVETLATVAFIMPTVVVATAVSAALSPGGPFGWAVPDGWDRGLPAILIAHVYFNYAVVLRMVGSYWRQLDRAPELAAAALGASPWRVFATVTWPRLKPAVWAAAGIVFLFTVTSFGVVLLLGLPGQATIEVEIQRQVLFLFNLPLGAALSLIQILIVIAMLVVQSLLSRNLASGVEVLDPTGADRPARSGRDRLAVLVFLVVSLLLLVGPIAAVFQRAMATGGGYGFDNFQALGSSRAGSILFVPPTTAIANSLLFATTATVISMVVGLLAAFALASGSARVLSGALLLPLGVSAVTLGFGALIAFDSAPLNLRGSPWLVPIVQSLVAIPFVVRAMVPVLRAIRVSLREAAAVLGASPWQVVRTIDVPLVARSAVVAAGFAFAISLGEFGATVFVARGDHPTVPIAIYRFLGSPGASNQGQAMAMAAILVVLTATVVLITDRFRVPEVSS